MTSSCPSSTAHLLSAAPDHPARGFRGLFQPGRPADPASFPPWLTPVTIVSMRNPKSHAELAELYRSSRAVVVWERTSAIHEALTCGCPVICIGNESFNKATYQPTISGLRRDLGVATAPDRDRRPKDAALPAGSIGVLNEP